MKNKNIPKASVVKNSSSIRPNNFEKISEDTKIVFSFESVTENEYFGFSNICEHWSKCLFQRLKEWSRLSIKEFNKFRTVNSPYRIHSLKGAKPPCELPPNTNIDDMIQLRLEKSKGGIHGILTDNIFYVIYFDPMHNVYPDDKYGGLRKLSKTECCIYKDYLKQYNSVE